MTNEDMQKFGKSGMDMTMTAVGAWSKGAQAIARELVDYSKKSAECSTAAWERLMGAKSLEKAMEVQTEYVKSACEDFATAAAKIGELYADTVKEACTPLEGVLAKASTTT
jgi:hypothetical protein